MITLQIKLNGSISSAEDPVSHIIRKSVDSAWQHFTEITLRQYYENPTSEWKPGTYEMIESLFNKRHIALKQEIIDATIMHISELISINPSAVQTAQFNPLLYQEETEKEPEAKEINTEQLSKKAQSLLNWLRDFWPEKNVGQSAIIQSVWGVKSLANCKLATKELEEIGVLTRNLKSIKIKGRMTRITWKINLPASIKVPPLPKKQPPAVSEPIDPVIQAWLDSGHGEHITARKDGVTLVDGLPHQLTPIEEEKPTIFRKIFPSFFGSKPQEPEPEVITIPNTRIPEAIPDPKNIEEIVKRIAAQKVIKKKVLSKALVKKTQDIGVDLVSLYLKYKDLYPSYGKHTIAEIIHEIDSPAGVKGKKLSVNSIYMMLKASIKDGKVDL